MNLSIKEELTTVSSRKLVNDIGFRPPVVKSLGGFRINAFLGMFGTKAKADF